MFFKTTYSLLNSIKVKPEGLRLLLLRAKIVKVEKKNYHAYIREYLNKKIRFTSIRVKKMQTSFLIKQAETMPRSCQ